MAENQIASEIMNKFSDDDYVEYVRYLNNRDAVSITQFYQSELGKYFWIDVRRCFNVERLNPNHVLEMFSVFSSMEASVLRETALKLMKSEVPFWKHASSVVMQMNFITYEEWCAAMEHENCMCDEFMIYVLSRLHYRHTLVYTANRLWCTMKLSEELDRSELHSKCDLHLVYLGNNTYGELKRKPTTPAPPTSLKPLPVKSKRKRRHKKSKTQSPPAAPIDLSSHTQQENQDELCFKPSSSGQTCGNTTGNTQGSDVGHSNDLIVDEARISDVSVNRITYNVDSLRDLVCKYLDATFPHVNPEEVFDYLQNRFKHSNRSIRYNVCSLEDITAKYIMELLPGIDPYKFCNEQHALRKEKCDTQKLSVLCRKQLLQRMTKLDIEKELVKRDSKDKRNLDIEKFLATFYLKRKATLEITKLQPETIRHWTKEVPSWTKIDPYSDLEDVGNTSDDSDSKHKQTNLENQGLYFDQIGGHCLRRRTRNYSASRSRREDSKDKFYREMCASPPKKQRKLIVKPSISGPSKNRLRAQDKIKNRNSKLKEGLDVSERLKQSYPLFDKKDKKHNAESDEEALPGELSDADTEIYDPPVQPKEEEENVQRCDVKTRTIGIKRRYKNGKQRKHKCKFCDGVFDSLAEINTHHKDTHPPVKCPDCKELFNTPSTLARHVYKHRKLRFKCDQCGSSFPFASDRDLHLNTHRKIKSFRCANPKCDKAYFSQGELDKHAKTHDNVLWSCTMCDYSNADERNLKSHMRVHSELKKYLCTYCLRLFKYDTQLRRHHAECKQAKNCPEDEVTDKKIGKIKRSQSPIF